MLRVLHTELGKLIGINFWPCSWCWWGWWYCYLKITLWWCWQLMMLMRLMMLLNWWCWRPPPELLVPHTWWHRWSSTALLGSLGTWLYTRDHCCHYCWHDYFDFWRSGPVSAFVFTLLFWFDQRYRKTSWNTPGKISVNIYRQVIAG